MKFEEGKKGMSGRVVNFVEKKTLYVVEEQPGDGTKYHHNILVNGNYLTAMARSGENGATVSRPMTFDREVLRDFARIFSDKEVYDDSRYLSENMFLEENSFTVASVIRCMIHLMEEGK